jgi:D-glycero-D-manno-heptose 1,7-bisphosphate phosphatase
VNDGRVGVFLDRDGTLNEELDFIRTPNDLHIISGAPTAVRKLNERGVIVCVISNQSGIARGYFSEEDLVPIHQKLTQVLAHEGARVDQIYYCPHHPTEGREPYNIVCDCRKPEPGMLLRGAKEFNVDLTRSFVVGDSVVDIQAGAAVGATCILVMTGYGKQSLEQCLRDRTHIDHVAPTVNEAVEFILHQLDATHQRT